MDRAGDRHHHTQNNHYFSPRSGRSSPGGLMSPIQSTTSTNNNNNDFSSTKLIHTPFTNFNQDQGDHQPLAVPVKKPVVRLLRRPSGVYIPEKSLTSQLSSSSNSNSNPTSNARFTSKAPAAMSLKSPRNTSGSSMTKGHINANVRPVDNHNNSSSPSSTASMRTPRSSGQPVPTSPRKSPFSNKFLWKKNEVDIESYCETRPPPSPSSFAKDSSSFDQRKSKGKERSKFGKILELDEEDIEKDHFYLESEHGKLKVQAQLQSQGDGKQVKKSVSSCTVDGLGFDLETIDLTNDTDRRVISLEKHGISSDSSSSASSPSSSESSIKKMDKSTRQKQDPNQDAYENPEKPESESSSSGSSDNDNGATRSARRYISVESLVLEDNFNATTTTNTTSASSFNHKHHNNNGVKKKKGGNEKQSSSCKTSFSSSSSSSSSSGNVEVVSSTSVTLIKNSNSNNEEEEIPQVKVVWTTPPQSSPHKSKDDEEKTKSESNSSSNSNSNSKLASKNNSDTNNSDDTYDSTKPEKEVPSSGNDNDSTKDHLNILNFFTRTEDGVEKEGRFEHVQPAIDKFFTASSSSNDDENSNSNSNAKSNSDRSQTKTINLKAVLDNMDEFVLQPAAIGYDVQCRITRDRKGVDRGLYPTYYMHLERPDGRKILLLTGRKRKKSTTSNYLISTDAADLSRDSNHFVGKVRSNLLGTQFTIYDNGQSHKRFGLFQTYGANAPAVREELVAVIYEPNVLGFKGPRKMKILIPEMKNEARRREHRPDNEKDSILELYKQGDALEFFELKNKAPIWNDDNQSFVLNFHGRVTQASVKNFQVIHEKKADYVLLQFGRIASDLFTMDYRYPLCALQAFAIVLTSFDNKLACE